MKMLPVDFTNDGQQTREATQFGEQKRTGAGCKRYTDAAVDIVSVRNFGNGPWFDGERLIVLRDRDDSTHMDSQFGVLFEWQAAALVLHWDGNAVCNAQLWRVRHRTTSILQPERKLAKESMFARIRI